MRKKRAAILAVCLSVCSTAAAVVSPVSTVAATTASFVSLGADLTAEQKTNVLELLNISAEELTEDNSVTVTNEEEHEYLDAYLDASVIGTHALSSAKVTAAGNGHGIQVETHNITYLTPDMYKNALATAGMRNADVIVAGPSPISGTAGLVGAMKAYAKMSGQVIEPQVIESATAELITSGELAEEIGDSEKAAQLIAAVKQVVIEKQITNETEIRNVIVNISNQLNITISDGDVEKLVALMKQLAGLDLNAEDLVEQARSVYEEATANGLDLSQYGISTADVDELASSLPGFLRAFINWLKGIFGM